MDYVPLTYIAAAVIIEVVAAALLFQLLPCSTVLQCCFWPISCVAASLMRCTVLARANLAGLGSRYVCGFNQEDTDRDVLSKPTVAAVWQWESR